MAADDNRLSGRDESHFFYAMQSDIDFHTLQSNIGLVNAIKISWQQNKLYMLTKDGIHIYNLIQ